MQIHGKKITTIVSDLDGTLLGEKREPDAAVFSLIAALRRCGIAFVAASGRQYKNMRRMFAPMAMELPFICENGSLVVKADETLYQRCISRELAFALLEDMLALPGVETIASSDRELYAPASRKDFIRLMNESLKLETRAIEDYSMIPGEINKLSVWWPGGIPEKEERWFHDKYDASLQVTDSGNGWLDFTAAGADKGTALRRLAELEGFSLEETLCFGDSENDIPMFRACGISYVMETGREHVKGQADHLCKNVSETLRGFLTGALPA